MVKSQDLIKYHLPDSPGVYMFKLGAQILYIGKATSLRSRLRSYFDNNLINTRGSFIVDMVFRANKVDFVKTDSVLEALILEANLIKKYQPKYNTKEKDDKSFNYVVITSEDFPRVLVVRGREIEKNLSYKIKTKFGPFTDGGSLKLALKIIRKIFPYRDKCAPLIGKPCFNKQLGLCPGVCDGTINKKDYQKNIRKICLFLSGRTSGLKKSLKREMNTLAKEQKFEKANEVKRQIFALEHIADVSLIKDSSDGQGELSKAPGALYRIEAYDVAHLSGTNNVGAMIVMENGELKKSDYRKFKINNSKGNDIGALEEILHRRFKHEEWQMPNLIVVDGGLAQMNTAKRVLARNNIRIPIVAVTKNERHKPKMLIGQENLVNKYKKEILLVNNEAHRFAIAFHRQRRSAII